MDEQYIHLEGIFSFNGLVVPLKTLQHPLISIHEESMASCVF